MSMTDLPKIHPSQGAVFTMAIFLGAFVFFFLKSNNETNEHEPARPNVTS